MVKLKIAFAIFLTLCYISPAASGLTQMLKQVQHDIEIFMPFLYQTFYNFRNLKNDKIDLSNREVYFVGENGQGKSNILESLYYASYGISFRTHVDSQIVKRGEKDFSVNSMFKKMKMTFSVSL